MCLRMGPYKNRGYSVARLYIHDDVTKWKHFPRYWPFLWGIHRWPVNSHQKSQWRRALMFSLIYSWINGWVNNLKAGDLRHHRTHYDVTVMHTKVPSTSGGNLIEFLYVLVGTLYSAYLRLLSNLRFNIKLLLYYKCQRHHEDCA